MPQIRQVIPQFLFSLFFFLFCLIFNVAMQIIVHQNVMNRKSHLLTSALYDPIHANTKDYSNKRHIIDYLMLLIIILTFLSFVFQRMRRCLNVFKRIFLLLGIMYFLRGISIVTLQIGSSPDPVCPKVHLESGFSAFLKHVWSVMTFETETCFDLLFSGHTGVLTILPLFWMYFASNRIHERVRPYARIVFLSISFFAIILLILCRVHYTLDVLYSFSISCVLFYGYHNIIWHVKQRVLDEKINTLRKAYESVECEHCIKRWAILFLVWFEYFNLKISNNKTVEEIV